MHLHAYIVNVKCFINFGTHCVHNIHHYHYDFSEIRPCTYALFKFLHNGLNIHIHAHVHTCTINCTCMYMCTTMYMQLWTSQKSNTIKYVTTQLL